MAANTGKKIRYVDARRNIVVPGDKEAAIAFAAQHFIESAKESIAVRGRFATALSGGSTPKAIFEKVTQLPLSSQLDWTKVFLFWSDERAVPPEHPESNYRMAMEAGFSSLLIPEHHIFRMKGEGNIEENALHYEKQINQLLPDGVFDLVMLGMGEDGHTASLFPKTHGLHSGGRLVVANFIPEKGTWRMTLTFKCINQAREIAIYILGKNKAVMLSRVLKDPHDPDLLPIQGIGTPSNKALIVADFEALNLMNLSR